MQCHTPCVKPSSAWGWRAPDHRETPRDKSETPARCLSEPVRETQAATNRFSGSTSDRNLGLLHTCCVGSASRPCSRLRSSEFRSVSLAFKAQGFPLILIPSTALVLVPPDQYVETVNSPTLRARALKRYNGHSSFVLEALARQLIQRM